MTPYDLTRDRLRLIIAQLNDTLDTIDATFNDMRFAMDVRHSLKDIADGTRNVRDSVECVDRAVCEENTARHWYHYHQELGVHDDEIARRAYNEEG